MPMLSDSPSPRAPDAATTAPTTIPSTKAAAPSLSTQATIPVSLQLNPDAIALRSALSILQLQRAQSLADLQALEAIKTQATSSVEAFTHEVRAGRVKMASGSVGLLGSEVGDVRPPKRRRREVSTTDESDNEDGSSQEEEGNDDSVMADGLETEHDQDDSDEQASVDLSIQQQQFPRIPAPQNIVRCPPINWNKYHIVGEPLDQLHEEQKRRPTNGEPFTEDTGNESNHPTSVSSGLGHPNPPEEALVAAPLRPLAGGDGLIKSVKSEGVRTRRKKT